MHDKDDADLLPIRSPQALMSHASFCRSMDVQRIVILNQGDGLPEITRQGRKAVIFMVKATSWKEQSWCGFDTSVMRSRGKPLIAAQ